MNAMTSAEIVKMANDAMVLGVTYNQDILVTTINAGYEAIQDGTVLARNGQQALVKRGDYVACEMDGVETKRTPIGDKKDKMLASYALKMASK